MLNEMNDQNTPGRVQAGRHTWVWVVAAVAVAVVLAGAGYFVYDAIQDDDATESTVPTDDGGTVALPQNPSLTLTLEDGVWYVENDGNVTMSGVSVRDDGGEVICEIGTLSPDDRKPCEDASENQSLVATGQGPQGQPVEVSSG